MKDKILKIAGVKSEKEFYKKFPSEEAFMKLHGKAFKKAKMGDTITQNSDVPPYGYNPDYMADDTYPVTGTNSLDANTLLGLAGASPTLKKGFNPNSYKFGQYTNTPASLGYNLSGDQSKQMFDLSGNAIQGKSAQQQVAGLAGASGKSGTGPMPYIQAGVDLIEGISMIGDEKKEENRLRQQVGVAGVQKKAIGTKDIDANRINDQFANLHEQNVTSGDTRYPTRGTGYDILQTKHGGRFVAQDGMALTNRVGGNPTEIQNTYGIGNSIYDNLGYTSLPDNNILKNYEQGGYIPRAASGYSDFYNNQGGEQLFNAASNAFINQGQGPSAGSKIGGAAGDAASALTGIPGLKYFGEGIGNIIDPHAAIVGGLQRDLSKITGESLMQGINNHNASQKHGGRTLIYENGGWMNPEYNPQVIAKFGDHSPEDIYHFAHQGMDSLRAGGNIGDDDYMQPSARALETMGTGGEVSTLWGGTIKPVAFNPHAKAPSFEAIGNPHSHIDSRTGETGIGALINGNLVEVENEPIEKLQDGSSGDTNYTVFGDMDTKLFGGKGSFKKNVFALNDKLKKANKQQEKASALVDTDDNSKIGTLTKKTGQTILDGLDKTYQIINNQKQEFADNQDLLHRIADAHQIIPKELSKGRIVPDKEARKQSAKSGAKFESAQKGRHISQEEIDRSYADRSSYINPDESTLLSRTRNSLYGMNPGAQALANITGAPQMYDYLSGNEQMTEGDAISMMTPGGAFLPEQWANRSANLGKYIPNPARAEYRKALDELAAAKSNINTGNLKPGSLDPSAFPINFKDLGIRGAGLAGLGGVGYDLYNIEPTPASTPYVAPPTYTVPPTSTKQTKQGQNPYMNLLREKNKLAEGGNINDPNNPYDPWLYSNPNATPAFSAIPEMTATNSKSNKVAKSVSKSNAKKASITPQSISSVAGTGTPLINQPAYMNPNAGFNPAFAQSAYDQAVTANLPGGQLSTYPGPGNEVPTERNKPATNTPDSKQSSSQFNPWLMGASQLVDYFRPAYKIPGQDYAPELAAAAMNQEEPVRGYQSYQPELSGNYNISLGDQLASIHSSFAGAKRAASSDPALLAQIAAQEGEASNRVLGEQFRMNQSQAAQTYGKNTDLLNDAKLKNIGQNIAFADKTAMAKSNTKQQIMEIIKSMSDKDQKNKEEQLLANIELRRNNYHVDPNTGRTIYMGPFAQFNTQGGGPSKGHALAKDTAYSYNDRGEIIGTYKTSKSGDSSAKHGAKIKARNSSIVKALKNL